MGFALRNVLDPVNVMEICSGGEKSSGKSSDLLQQRSGCVCVRVC